MSGIDTGPSSIPQGPIQLPGDLSGAANALGLRKAANDAIAAGDMNALGAYRNEMIVQGEMSTMMSEIVGEDPAEIVRPNAAHIDPDIEIARRGRATLKREMALRDAATSAGWKELNTWFKEIKTQYQVQNEEPIMKWRTGMKAEDQIKMMRQMEPITVDPEKLAAMRQIAMQIDGAVKAIDPQSSFWTHPNFKEVSKWLNRESSSSSAGYMKPGAQQMDIDPLTRGAVMVMEGAEVAQDLGLNLIYGGWELGRQGLASMGVYDVPGPPTNYITGDDGKIYTNGARPPGITEISAMMWAEATGRDVLQTVADLGRAREMEEAQRNGLEEALQFTAKGAGMFVGMLPAAEGMAVGMAVGGKAFKKGMVYLAGLGYTGAKSERALKIVSILGKGTGAMTVNGSMMAQAYGRMDDYGTQFLHGAIMAPVMLAFGAMGRGVERTLLTRANMPGRVSAFVGGAMEGAGFGALGDIERRGLWEFLKDPTQGNWAEYVGNMLAFGMMKGMGARSPFEVAMAETNQAHIQRSLARRAAGEQINKGEISGERFSDVKSVSDIGKLTVKVRESEAAGNIREAERFRKERDKIEERMDIEELGSDPTKAEMREFEREFDEAPPPIKEGDIQVPEVRSKMGIDRKGSRQGVGSFQSQPARQLEGVEGAKPTSLDQIFRIMEGDPGKQGVKILGQTFGAKKGDPVKVSMSEARISGKAKGFFDTMNNAITLRAGRDLTVGAHEWSHAMMRHTLGVSRGGRGGKAFAKAAMDFSRQLPIEARAEFDKILEGYPNIEKATKGVRAGEAWAELFARDLLSDGRLETEVPNLHRWMKSWLASPQQASLRGQYGRIKESIHDYMMQGASGRVRQSRLKDAYLSRVRKTKASTRVRKWLFDDLAEVREARDRYLRATGKEAVDMVVTNDPVRMMEISRGTAASIARGFMLHGRTDAMGNKLGEGLVDILRASEKAVGLETFLDFLQSKRSIESHQKARAKGTTIDTIHPISDYVRTLREIPPEHRVLMKELNTRLKEWVDSLTDYVQEKGGMSVEEATRIKEAYAFYIPFMRAIDAPLSHGQGRGSAERGHGHKRMKGSTFEIRDPIKALEEVTTRLVQKGLQAETMKTVYKFARSEEVGGFAKVVPKAQVPHELKTGDVLDKIKKANPEGADLVEGLREIPGLEESTILLFSTKAYPFGEKSIVQVPVNLQEWEISAERDPTVRKQMRKDSEAGSVWLQIDPKVYNTLMGIENQAILHGVFRAPTQWVRLIAVELNPAFTMANVVRDVVAKGVFSNRGYSKYLPVIGGAMDWVSGMNMYLKGHESAQLFRALGGEISTIGREGTERRILGENDNVLTKAIDKWRGFLAAPESFIRIKEFNDALLEARTAGKSEPIARMEALEAAKEVTVNFAKGGVGSRVINQAVPFFKAAVLGQEKLFRSISTPRGFAMAIANVTAPSMIIWALFKDDKWYQDLPEWRRRNSWNISFDGGKNIMSWPKPFELGILFGTMPEMLADYSTGRDRQEIGQAVQEALLPFIRNIGGLIPQVIKPFVETGSGHSSFTGRPMTPEWMQRSRKPIDQMTAQTTETSRIMFDWFGRYLPTIDNPIEMEALLGGYTANFSTTIARTIDDLTGLKDYNFQLNPLNRFTKQTAHGQGVAVDKLYQLSKDLDQRSDELSATDLRLRRDVNRAKKRLSAINKRQRSGGLSREEADKQKFDVAQPFEKR